MSLALANNTQFFSVVGTAYVQEHHVGEYGRDAAPSLQDTDSEFEQAGPGLFGSVLEALLNDTRRRLS